MEIHFEGSLTRDDYRKILIHNNARHTRLIVFFGLFLLIISFLMLYPVISNPSALADTVWLLKRLLRIIPGLVLYAAVITYPWWISYLSFNQKGNIYRKGIFGNFNDSGFEINNDEGLNARLAWDALVAYQIINGFIKLYQNPNSFYVFKRSMFTHQDEWDHLVALVKEKVIAKQ
jgi:hypothetical protein